MMYFIVRSSFLWDPLTIVPKRMLEITFKRKNKKPNDVSIKVEWVEYG